ncbi:cell division protein ZipA C-terminal FtsZ-binding domain-containing protein [Neisseria sp. Ec49-e6-T10]|uniref:cell division protein ZipA C-terminal FtsZ-binding domain-containing protein n=1 Tax=Neisseria sp. Ec49-e6-T10 TaxID=3140744 RepID=UPI003EB838AA
MSDLQLILVLLIIGLAVVACIFAYNIYQENQFRKKIRSQFGGSQEDALLNVSKNQVRDAEEELLRPVILDEEHASAQAVYEVPFDDPDDEEFEPVLTQEENVPVQEFVFEQVEVVQEEVVNPVVDTVEGKWLLDLDDLSKVNLSWFDKRIDYLAFVALPFAQELTMVPRLSNRRRFRVVGCTVNNRFQEAEAVPSVQYQGFVLGLQAIDRNGLTSEAELQQFTEQAAKFATQMQAGLKLTDQAAFLEKAQVIDHLCEEVDKVIAIHLVSRTTIPGTELRHALEEAGFVLEHDGVFYFNDAMEQPLFTIVTLDNSPFTAPLLAKQAYRGFSMLFSVALIADGEKVFNQFMELAVRFSSQLHLDLVDDKRQELSTTWLKEIREYVVVEQQKMIQADIPPGGELAQRLFS